MVGLLGLVRVIPLLVFSLFGGVLADQADRRTVLVVAQSAMATISLALCLFTVAGAQSLTVVYGAVALNAIARAFEQPARQATQVSLVPPVDYPNAASLNGVTWRLSDVLGPVVTGFMIAAFKNSPTQGLSICYGINFISFFVLIMVILRLPKRAAEDAPDQPHSIREVLERIKEGLRFVNNTPVVRSAMWIDFWATLLSGAEALLPAFAAKILKLGPEGYGILAASTGIGALIAAGFLTLRPTVKRQGPLVVWMIASYGLFTVCFGLAQTLWVAALCLALVGATDMVSTVMRQTIRQLATPDALRGRMNATGSLFHISGPQLGDFEAGAVASVAGERFSIVLGGGLCMFVALHWSRAKALMTYEHRD